MKKILIIALFITLIPVYDVKAEFNFDTTGANYTADQASQETYDSADQGTYNFGDQGTYESSVSDVKVDTKPVDQPTFEEYSKKNKDLVDAFSANDKNVPKLSIKGLIYWIVGVLNQLVYVIIGVSLVVFLYGILKLSFIDGQKPEAREQSRKFMFWGIVSLFVMVSVWGLVNILQFTFFDKGGLIMPQLK